MLKKGQRGDKMFLTKEEERILDGEEGEVKQLAMKLLVKLGEKFKAEKLIKISSVQIAGISYKTIGDPGLEFIESLVSHGARVCVPAFMNPAGMDLENWKEMGIKEEFAEKQRRIVEALKKAGVIPASTCTPYLCGLLPGKNEHIAWSESSAVIFANSVIGALTNREGGPSALASAVIGKTPFYGLHIKENRKPSMLVEFLGKIKDECDMNALAYCIAKESKSIPYVKGVNISDTDLLKGFGATLAAYNSLAIFHMENITPEAKEFCNGNIDFEEKIKVDSQDLEKAKKEMGDEAEEEADIIMIGCPHTSAKEIAEINEKLGNRRMRKEMWIFTSKPVKVLIERSKIAEELGKKNVRIIADTCPVVAPIEDLGIKCVVTNSGKATFYLPSACKAKVIFMPIHEILERFSE